MKKFDIVGEWLWGSTVYNEGADGAVRITERMSKSGITDIYLLVKGENGNVAYNKGSVPLGRSWPDRDITAEIIAAAHHRGIRVHAWSTFLKDGTYLKSYLGAGVGHYGDFADKPNKRGSGGWISPLCSDYLKYTEKLFAELMTEYDFDGLHFDCIRYGGLYYGWTAADVKKMKSEMGAEGFKELCELVENTFYKDGGDKEAIFRAYSSGNANVEKFVKMRAENINNVITSVKKATAKARDKKHMSPLVYSAAFMPEGASEKSFEEDPKAGSAFGTVHYGQDYNAAGKLLDYVCPMAYSGAYGKPASWTADTAACAAAKGNKVVIGMQSYGDEGSMSTADMTDVISDIYALNCEGLLGFAHFRTGTFMYANISAERELGSVSCELLNSLSVPVTRVEMTLKSGSSVLVVADSMGKPTTKISDGGKTVTLCAEELIEPYGDGKLKVAVKDLAEGERPLSLKVFSGDSELRVYERFINK